MKYGKDSVMPLNRVQRLGSHLLTAAVAIFVLASCGGGSSSDDSSTIDWLTHNPAETAASDRAAEKLVERFESEHPDVTVQRDSISRDELIAVLRTRLQSGTGPDVFQYDTGPARAGQLADAGQLLELDDAYENYSWDIYDWARERVVYDGSVMGVPDQVEALGVFYNKDLFEEMGLEVPTTVDELEAISDQLKAADYTPMAFANQDQWPGASMLSMVTTATVGREGMDDILFGDGQWNTPELVDAIDRVFVDFTERGFYPESLNGIAYEDANSLFYTEQAAMLPTGTWLIAEIDESVDFEVGFFPFPAIGDVPPALATGLGDGWFVSSKSDSPDASLEFLDFWFSEETGRVQLEEFSTIPAFPVDTEGLDLSPLFAETIQAIESAGDTAGYNLDVMVPADFNDVMYAGLQEVISGSRSAQEQADALQDVWEQSADSRE